MSRMQRPRERIIQLSGLIKLGVGRAGDDDFLGQRGSWSLGKTRGFGDLAEFKDQGGRRSGDMSWQDLLSLGTVTCVSGALRGLQGASTSTVNKLQINYDSGSLWARRTPTLGEINQPPSYKYAVNGLVN
jgi:hypothetical protein